MKADGVLISGNSFVECAGTVTLRHGNGSTVRGNVIAGKLKKETGGIRVYGSRHQILDNVIIGTTGRAGRRHRTDGRRKSTAGFRLPTGGRCFPAG